LEAAVPQQRKLVITVTGSERKKFESAVVELSDEAERELNKTINDVKAHRGQIISVDLEKP
jgi:hypothetical protein